MKLHLDGIVFSLQSHGGISVYFRELLTRLQLDDVPGVLTIENPSQQFATLSAGSISLVQRASRPFERYRRARGVPDFGASIFHSTYYRLPQTAATPTVVTVHDFAYERCQHGPRRWLHSTQKYAAIRSAQAIICISEATRDDLLELVGLRSEQQLHVIYNGVSSRFHRLPIMQSVVLDPPIILFVGQRGRYKNFSLLLKSMMHLPADFELHCVGGGPFDESEFSVVCTSVRRRVKHLGQIDDASLNRCYNSAACLAYVSSYEGFGIPVVEAMRAGCPVVSVPCKAVQEVGKGALTVAEPNPASIAEAIRQCLNQTYRQQVVELGQRIASSYDWQRTYEHTLSVYRSL